MHAPPKRPAARSAFTLVELLTVIVIIGVLAGLITAAAIPAIRAAKQTTIGNEISQLELALGQYKEQFGDYPPDFAGVNDTTDKVIQAAAQQAVLRHLRKAFPRYRPGAPREGIAAVAPKPNDSLWQRFVDDVDYGPDRTLNHTPDVNLLGPDSAMVFWLGGLPATGGTTKLAGFSANPADPFAATGSRLPALFEFDETRLVFDKTLLAQNPSILLCRYVPKHVESPGSGDPPPYVYFRARSEGYTVPDKDGKWVIPSYPQRVPGTPIDSGTCVPYAAVVTLNANGDVTAIQRWCNPKTFQIVCAGLDGEFSQPDTAAADYIPPGGDFAQKIRYLSPNQGNLSSSEDDNLTNFAQGRLTDGVH